jgi:predicted dehydrogenase
VVAAIRDERPPAVTGEDGMRAVDLMSGIYHAASDGRRVEIPARNPRGAAPG